MVPGETHMQVGVMCWEETVWAGITVDHMLAALRPRERELIERRMAGDIYKELGLHFGVSAGRAQQIEQQALRKMRIALRKCEDTHWRVAQPPVRPLTKEELEAIQHRRAMIWKAGQAERDRRVAKMLREKERAEEWERSSKVLTEEELDLREQQFERFEEWKDRQGRETYGYRG